MWFIIVINTALATTDLYPAGHSKEQCEQTIEKARSAEPQPPQPDIRVECVESSQLESWSKAGHAFRPPAER